MGFLPSPDSIIIVFFTLFLLTIFQYVFFFNVTTNTFKDVVVKNATDIIGDRMIYNKRMEIIKYLGDKNELEKEHQKSLSEKNKKNKIVKERAIKYIILSGILFLIITIGGILLFVFGNYDISSIIPKLILSVILVILGFSTELYLYYLVIKPYKYTSKYEIISLLIRKIKEKSPNTSQEGDINSLINCIPKLLSNEKCNLSPMIKESLKKSFKFD